MSHDQNEQAAAQAGKEYAARLWQFKQAETVAAMIYVGKELGLYKATGGCRPGLSSRTGREDRLCTSAGCSSGYGCRQQPRVIDYVDEEHFELPETGAAMLADEGSSRQFMLDSFEGGVGERAIENLLESFRTGIGRSLRRRRARGRPTERSPTHQERQDAGCSLDDSCTGWGAREAGGGGSGCGRGLW